MAHNRDDLATRALQELRLIGEGQAASAAEMAAALAAIPPLLDRLRFLHVYAAPNSYGFSDAVFLPLARLLAEDLAPSLAGRPSDPGLVEAEEGRLRLIRNQPLIRNPVHVERPLRVRAIRGMRWP